MYGLVGIPFYEYFYFSMPFTIFGRVPITFHVYILFSGQASFLHAVRQSTHLHNNNTVQSRDNGIMRIAQIILQTFRSTRAAPNRE